MLKPALYKALYTVVVFFANLLLANLLLPALFGTVSLMIVNAAIVYLVTGLGTDSVVMHAVTNNKWTHAEAAAISRYGFGVQLLLFALLQWAHFALFSTTLLAGQAAPFLLYEILYFTGLALVEKSVVLLYAQGDAALANKALFGAALFYIAVLFAAMQSAFFSAAALIGLFCGQSLLQGAVVALLYAVHRRRAAGSRFRLQKFYGVLKMSLVVLLTNFIQLLAYRIDFLLIGYFGNDYQVGLYAQANKFANLMWIVPNIFALLLMVRFAKIGTKGLPLLFRSALVLSLLLLAVTVVATLFFYAYLIAPAYSAGLAAFYLMLPGYFCWSIVIYFGAFFSWQGRFANNLIISGFCLALISVCDFFLIPRFAIRGAAVANSIAYSSTLVLCFYLLSRQVQIRLRDIFAIRKTDYEDIKTYFS